MLITAAFSISTGISSEEKPKTGGSDTIDLEQSKMDPAEYNKKLKQYLKEDFNKEEIKELKIEVPFSIKYDKHIRELEYRDRKKQIKTSLHWGQRKLLMSEIYFLTKYGHLSKKVVYAGAARGDHLLYLSKLFPEHEFELWDPNPFHKKLHEHPKFTVNQDYFTDKVAKSYSKDDILFWSDIRTGDPAKGMKSFEDAIDENMKMQAKWHKLSNAKMSMLKFRLPYVDPGKPQPNIEYKYLDGEIVLQIWAPLVSTETRLIVERGAKNKTYNSKEYESRMFRFNTITRQWQFFPHDVLTEHGIDHCFDCRAEIYTLAKYIRSKDPEIGDVELSRQVLKMIKEISESITSGKTLYIPPHGVEPDMKMNEKYVYLRDKFYNKFHNRQKKIEEIRGY